MRSYYFLLFIFLFKVIPSNAGNFNNGFPKKDTIYVIQIGKEWKSTELKTIRDKVKRLNSDKGVFMEFKSPYQYTYIGYFKSKKEAEEFQDSIKEEFPNTIIIPRVPSKK